MASHIERRKFLAALGGRMMPLDIGQTSATGSGSRSQKGSASYGLAVTVEFILQAHRNQ